MKYVVNITSGRLTGTLENDNLRGEGRWERMITRGLLTIGKPVGTPQPKWDGDGSPNWLGHVEDLSDCTYIAIYGGPDQPKAKVYLFNFFSAPNERIEGEIREIMSRAGHRNLFLTYNYPSASVYDKLADDLKDRVAWIPLPVPEPTTTDPTENTVLFFPARNIVDSMLADKGEVIHFVRLALLHDKALTFECLGKSVDQTEDLWANPLFYKAFHDLRDRVTVHENIDHAAVQAIYARTRLVVCPSGYGGPPIESARCGIPVIALERDCSLYRAPYTPGFPELPRLTVHGPKMVEILDRLLYDKPYARLVGNAGRDYIRDYFSPTAFAKALAAIEERVQ